MSGQRPVLKRFGAPLCALVLLLGVALFPRVEIKPRLKVAVSVWPGSEALVLGRDSGLMPQDRIRVVELPWASAVARTFDDGVADVAVLTLDGVLQLREAGHKLRVILVIDESLGGDAVLARQEIPDLAALRNKRVGVDVFGVGMYVLVNALEQGGMTLADVQTVPLIQPEIESMFQDGSIDAAVAAEPWLTQIKDKNMRQAYGSQELKVPILRMLVASEHACTMFEEELAIIVRTVTTINRQMRSGKPFQGLEAILRREKVTAEQFIRSLARWRPVDGAQNAEMLGGAEPKLEALAQAMTGQMLRHGLLHRAPGNDKWIDPQFLKAAWD